MLVPGTVVELGRGPYRIEERLATGGFADVYRGIGPDRQDCAIKVFKEGSHSSRELSIGSSVTGTHLVPLIDSGECSGRRVVTMPLARGTLRDYLNKSGPLGQPGALEIANDICAGLIEMHQESEPFPGMNSDQIIHRDLKPENILDVNGMWCISDFGIAKRASAPTSSGTLRGYLSDPYAAPEQWRDDTSTLATDIYAFGCILYELIAGHPPFNGRDRADYRKQHLEDLPPKLNECSPELRALLFECLQKEPMRRPTALQIQSRINTQPSLESPVIGALLDARTVAAQADTQRQIRRAKAVERNQVRDREWQSAQQQLNLFAEHIASQAKKALDQSAVGIGRDGSLRIIWDRGFLGLSAAKDSRSVEWAIPGPEFDVIAHARIAVSIAKLDDDGEITDTAIDGRVHCLWYCDAETDGDYAWYETAFISSKATFDAPYYPHPDAPAPGPETGKALSQFSISDYRLAWPFQRLDGAGRIEAVDRWLRWFAEAIKGQLSAQPYPVGDVYRGLRVTTISLKADHDFFRYPNT